MANEIKIGINSIDSFKVGTYDCQIFLGTVKLYPNVTPVTTPYLTFVVRDFNAKFKLSGNTTSYSLDSGETWTSLSANTWSPVVASGSTNGSGGIQKAYEIASKYFIQGGNNRIILATDGDFNVGPSSNDELKEQVKQQLNSGIYLSVLGVGMGNYQDDMVETLAMHGNGNYAYIDSLIEARKVLTEEGKILCRKCI